MAGQPSFLSRLSGRVKQAADEGVKRSQTAAQSESTASEQAASQEADQKAKGTPPGPGSEPPNPPPPPSAADIDIENQTARRIGILAKDGRTDPFIIAPFGARRLKQATEEEVYAYKRWENFNLIQVREVKPTEPGIPWAFAIGCWALFLLIFGVILAVLIPTFSESPVLKIVITGLALLVVFLFVRWAWKKSQGFRFMDAALKYLTQFLVIFLVIAAGLALPAAVAFNLGGIAETGIVTRALPVVFVAAASTLPALFYFIFERQKVITLREQFFRQVVLLDPDTCTTEEAEERYGQRVNEVYGQQGTVSMLNVGMPILISTALITVGWLLVLLPLANEKMAVSGSQLFAPQPTAVNIGFLGAYFFALNMIFRRYVRADLTPKAYNHITLRIIVTLILVWILSLVPEIAGQAAAQPSPVLLVLAFFIGVVPETGITLLQAFLRKSLSLIGRPFGMSLVEEDPLTKLEGVNLYDMARLSEEGIENIQSLANHNLTDLLLQTRISASRLVDWVDQAVLYLHVKETQESGDKPSKDNKQFARERLRQYGIRTATDLEAAYQACATQDEKERFLTLLDPTGAANTQDQAQQPVKKLKVVMDTMADDQWMAQLRHWRTMNQLDQRLYCKPEDFFEGLSAHAASGYHPSLLTYRGTA